MKGLYTCSADYKYMVYLRKHMRKGKAYYSVVETFRENGKVKQKIIHYIGSEKRYASFMKEAINAKDFLSQELENLSYQAPLALWNIAQELEITKIFSGNLRKKS